MLYAIDAPSSLEPQRGGLLQHANVIDGANPQLFVQGPTYEEGALLGHNKVIPAPGTDKEFDEIDLSDGVIFGAYRGIDWPMMNGDRDKTILKAAFESGESWAVERAVQEKLITSRVVDLTPTPGTPVTKVNIALGLLQKYAADTYAGLPLLHGSKFTTELLDDHLEVDTDAWKLHTKQGVPLANGGGYTEGPGADAAQGTGWLYITGQVHVWRSELIEGEGYEVEKNRKQKLVERLYAANIDSFVAGVLIGA